MLLNVIYRAILVILTMTLVWNTIKLKDAKKQIMSAVLIIPFVLRIIGVK